MAVRHWRTQYRKPNTGGLGARHPPLAELLGGKLDLLPANVCDWRMRPSTVVICVLPSTRQSLSHSKQFKPHR